MNKFEPAIYDDKKFFDNYIDLRNAENNYNDLIEQPIVFDLVGDVSGKSVLDIGCGYGAMTVKLADAGASRAVGLDVSEMMVGKAKIENPRDNIEYKILSAEALDELGDSFDVIVSCLAIHYIEDLDKLFRDVYARLNKGGELVFSMEHPMYTASKSAQKWERDENGAVIGFTTDNYGDEGVRHIEWLEKVITKYHHKTETVINALIKSGFILDRVLEPSPSEELMRRVPKTVHELHRPAYLVVKCHKG